MQQDNSECCRRSFAASIKDTANRILSDPTMCPRDVADYRYSICQACDHFVSKSKTCELCQCFLPLKTVAANMRCPIDKWEEWKRDAH